MKKEERMSDEEYEKHYERKIIEKSIYVEIPFFLCERGITWLKMSGYFEVTSDACLLFCAICAVIQPYLSYGLYYAELGLFLTFILTGILHMLANSFDYQEKSGIIKEKKRLKGF